MTKGYLRFTQGIISRKRISREHFNSLKIYISGIGFLLCHSRCRAGVQSMNFNLSIYRKLVMVSLTLRLCSGQALEVILRQAQDDKKMPR